MELVYIQEYQYDFWKRFEIALDVGPTYRLQKVHVEPQTFQVNIQRYKRPR